MKSVNKCHKVSKLSENVKGYIVEKIVKEFQQISRSVDNVKIVNSVKKCENNFQKSDKSVKNIKKVLNLTKCP